MFRVLISFGTRPEVIKLFPVIKLLKGKAGVDVKVLHTGQHREMASDLLARFSIEPDYNLGLMTSDQTLVDVTTKTLPAAYEIIGATKPHLVFVQGDTNSAFGVALAAYYQRTAVAHVEAGLRTGNIYSPWPEEGNRKLISVVANLHFAPTNEARANLISEGVAGDAIFQVGNTSIDAVLQTRALFETDSKFAADVEASLVRRMDGHHPGDGVGDKKIVLVTNHRRENFGGAMESVCTAVRKLADLYEDIQIVFPVHPNPAVRASVTPILSAHPRIKLTEPLPYFEFVSLFLKAYLVITDSGGIQEEAVALGKPTLVTRSETERMEGVSAGIAFLVGPNEERIVSTACKLLDEPELYRSVARSRDVYGDGSASRRIVDQSLRWLHARFGTEPES